MSQPAAELLQLNAQATQARMMLGAMCVQFRTQAAAMNAPADVVQALADFEKAFGALADSISTWTLRQSTDGVQ